MTVRVNWVAAAFGVFGLLMVAACAPARVAPPPPPMQPVEVEPEPLPGPDDEIRVGLLLPLSGPAEALGNDMLQAAQLALFDVGENRIVLLPRDTQGTPEAARLAAREVIEEGATLILGPLFSQAVRAVSPIARAADVRVLAFSNDATAASEGTYLLGFRPEEQVVRVTRFAIGRELRRIAGLAPDDAYGATALDGLRRTVIEAGGQLASAAFYPPDLADPSVIVREVAAYDARRAALQRERQRWEQQDGDEARRELRRLETLDTFGEPPFDAVLIADGGDRLRSVASLLTFFDITPGEVRFLGTMRWQEDPRALQEAALQGGWFAASPPSNIEMFKQRFQSTFGAEPQALAALAYDATALAVIVARDLGDRLYDPLTLTDPEGFTGATGLFRLRPDGLADHGLAILEVGGGTAREIDPPPATFVPEVAADFWP